MTEDIFSDQSVLEGLRSGPLGHQVDSFAALLREQGYARSTRREKVRLVGAMSNWFHRRGLGMGDVNEETIGKFLKHRRRPHRSDRATLRALTEHLREVGVISPPARVMDTGMLSRIQHEYAEYLTQERGLSEATIANYGCLIRDFLRERFGDDDAVVLNELRPSDVTDFMKRYVRRPASGRAALMVTGLRSFFRFLLVRGDTEIDLAASVPSVANWRLASVPKYLEPEEVESFLASCDQENATGQRDYAILLLLARLGLRAGEVVAMTLEDIDWEAGVLTVRGKGSRQDQLPIPKEVGEALAKYLRHCRPQCSTRCVFVRMKAPLRGFASSVAICTVVRRALERAGLEPAHKGAHLLRHSLATGMLRKGASLSEIGELLRHRLESTTEIYAKVDLTTLHTLAQPWPLTHRGES